MFIVLLKKELLHMVTGYRASIFIVINVLLFTAGALSYVQRHSNQAALFDRLRAMETDRLNRARDARLMDSLNYQVMRSPGNYDFVQGRESEYPDIAVFSARSRALLTYSHSFEPNYFVPRYQRIDWSFGVLYILSFCAAMLCYDCVSAEREGGTLKLIWVNSVPLAKVLCSKVLAGSLVIVMSIVLSTICGMVVISSVSGRTFGMTDHLYIVGWCIYSWLFLSVYICLGAMTSCACRSSTVSLYASLCIWICFTVLALTGARLVGVYVYPAQTKVETQHEIQMLMSATRGQGDVSQIYDEGLKRRLKRARLVALVQSTSPNGLADLAFETMFEAGSDGFESWLRSVSHAVLASDQSVGGRSLDVSRIGSGDRIGRASLENWYRLGGEALWCMLLFVTGTLFLYRKGLG